MGTMAMRGFSNTPAEGAKPKRKPRQKKQEAEQAEESKKIEEALKEEGPIPSAIIWGSGKHIKGMEREFIQEVVTEPVTAENAAEEGLEESG
jgi:hypothetical protein